MLGGETAGWMIDSEHFENLWGHKTETQSKYLKSNVWTQYQNHVLSASGENVTVTYCD